MFSFDAIFTIFAMPAVIASRSQNHLSSMCLQIGVVVIQILFFETLTKIIYFGGFFLTPTWHLCPRPRLRLRPWVCPVLGFAKLGP